jgi:PAS domain S-box-containing protein
MNQQTEISLRKELDELRFQLDEANDTIDAIRTGKVDALVLDDGNGHEIYTLKTADLPYRVFIEKMSEGAVTLNEEGFILYANSRFAKMVGKELTNVIGTYLKELIVEQFIPRFEDILVNCLDEDCKEEMALLGNDGNLPVQLSLTSVQLEGKRTWSIFVTDLTMQKKLRRQLEENNRQLQDLNNALEISNNDLVQFASVASHDLQEPLRKIQIFSSLLQNNKTNFSLEDYELYVSKILKSAARMRTLIEDVLNYSKLSANENILEQLDLNEIVHEVLEDFELMIDEKFANISIGHLPIVQGNKGQIRQVFQNILSNALKFSKKGNIPIIEISSQRILGKSFDSEPDENGNYCLVYIKDNGIGFDVKYQKNIFALFERLNSKDSYEGTGIGLAITKRIMEKHNGLVKAEGELGQGARFILLFPCSKT